MLLLFFYSDHIYGLLDGKNVKDANPFECGTTIFNAKDQVKITGVINTVSIDFAETPSTEGPEICLFIVKKTKTLGRRNIFQIVNRSKLTINTKNIKRETAIQKFNVGGIPVDKGQYLAIRFAQGAGSPHATERDECYIYRDSMPFYNQCLEFTKYSTYGVSMSFAVQPKTGLLI